MATETPRRNCCQPARGSPFGRLLALSGLALAAATASAAAPVAISDWSVSTDGPEGPWHDAASLEEWAGPGIAWIRLQLPQGQFREPTLYVFGILPAFRVELNGQELARWGDPYQGVLGPEQGLQWHVVALPPDAPGRALVVALYRPQRDAVELSSMRLGSRSDAARVFQLAVRQPLRGGAPAVAFAVVLMALGACTIALRVVRLSREPALVSFGLVCLLYGLRLATTSELSWFLLFDPSPLARRWIVAVVTYVIPVPWTLFFEQIAGRGWHNSIRRVWQLALAYAAIGLSFDIVTGEPGRALGLNPFLVVLTIVVALGNLFLGGIPKMAELPALRAGYVVFAAFVLGQNLAELGMLSDVFRVEAVGFGLLLLCFGYAVAERSLRQQRQLSALEQELATARRIQASLLPASVPAVAGGSAAVRFVPAAAVAGDLYDFVRGRGDGLGILLADVSGHGVPAALIASMVKVAAAAAAQHAERPGHFLAAVNETLVGQLGSQFVTAVYVYADPIGGHLRLASAGHPPPLLWRQREQRAQAVGENGILMGQFAGADYPTTEIPIRSGDRLLLYTDGVTEATDPAGEMFGSERLGAALARQAGGSAEECATQLLDGLRRWAGRAAFDDDVSLVVLDLLGTPIPEGDERRASRE